MPPYETRLDISSLIAQGTEAVLKLPWDDFFWWEEALTQTDAWSINTQNLVPREERESSPFIALDGENRVAVSIGGVRFEDLQSFSIFCTRDVEQPHESPHAYISVSGLFSNPDRKSDEEIRNLVNSRKNATQIPMRIEVDSLVFEGVFELTDLFFSNVVGGSKTHVDASFSLRPPTYLMSGSFENSIVSRLLFNFFNEPRACLDFNVSKKSRSLKEPQYRGDGFLSALHMSVGVGLRPIFTVGVHGEGRLEELAA